MNRKSTEAADICDVLRKAQLLGSKTSIIAFEGTKWENRNVDTQFPRNANNPVFIKQSAVKGEHAPVSVGLFNITDRFLNVRIDYKDTQGLRIKALHSINTITALGHESWDPLPELNESRIITIPPLKSREVWLDIDLAEAEAGVEAGVVFFRQSTLYFRQGALSVVATRLNRRVLLQYWTGVRWVLPVTGETLFL